MGRGAEEPYVYSDGQQEVTENRPGEQAWGKKSLSWLEMLILLNWEYRSFHQYTEEYCRYTIHIGVDMSCKCKSDHG